MKKLLISLTVISLTVFLGTTSCLAITLGFNLAFQNIDQESTTTVDVVISGLGNNMAPSLGAFDLDVTFDDLLLEFTGLTFGNQLDLTPPSSGGPFGTINGFAEDPNPAVGLVDFFEISLDAPSTLDTLQAGSFTLAALSFSSGLLTGNSPLSILPSSVLSDSLGNTLTYTTTPGNIQVVPEPATIILLASGLAAIAGIRRKRKFYRS